MKSINDPKPSDAPSINDPAPTKTVKVINQNPRNGQIGAVATPLAKDVDAWIARGWVRA